MKKVFSFDAETDGLWGNPFAIAAIVYDENGNESDTFIAKMPSHVVSNEWVMQNVLPALEDLKVSHNTYDGMLRDFATFYMEHKNDADIICHVGIPVEAHLIREMHRLGFIGDWDGPFPLIDIAGNLKQVGEDPTSVDSYAKKYGLEIADYGTTHNPLYDCEVAAKVYIDLCGHKKFRKQSIEKWPKHGVH